VVVRVCRWVWMVVRFVCVIRVPVCARVSRVCPGSPRCLFTGIRISDDPKYPKTFLTVSGSTWTTHTSYLYLPDGKMATIRLTRMALEPAGYTPYV
jgi:hypothetical protein